MRLYAKPCGGRHDILIIDESTGRDVAIVRGDDDASRALAGLMVASREMLDALRKCVEPLEPGEHCGLPADTYNMVCAAIIKAGG